MITEIENISSKSFNDYTSEAKFKETNIIFGTNGSGKTSLCDWLEERCPEVSRVFNSEYVSKNILAQNSLSGVKLTVGSLAVNLEENIARIVNANKNIQEQKRMVERNLVIEKESLFAILDNNLKQARNHFDLTAKINQKSNAKLDPVRALKLWLEEIEPDLTTTNSSKELEQQKKIYGTKVLDLQFTMLINRQDFNDFVIKMKKSVANPSMSVTNEIAQWLVNGLSVHNMENEQEICQFCGNKFDVAKVKETINEKIKNDHAKLVRYLDTFMEKLIQLEHDIKNIGMKFDEIDIKPAVNCINKMREKIEEKNQDTTLSISILNKYFEEILTVDTTVKRMTSNCEAEIKNINHQLSKIEIVAKSWIGQQLKNNPEVNKIETEIQKNEEWLFRYNRIIDKNEEWMTNQKMATSDLTAFKELANHQFKLLGLDFKLDIMDDNQHYLVKSLISNKILKTSDLSEGECRLLGFLHFYFDLFDKPNESLKSEVKTILIDDPITSLDNNNRYYLTELINGLVKKIEQLDCQLFIFTHSSLDFHNLGFNADKKKTEWFKINKDIEGNSEIKIANSTERKNYSDYYQANFKDVFKFAMQSKSKLPNINYISYGNKARLLFESHARTHYRLEYTTNNQHGDLIKFYQIPDNIDEEFKNMLDVINSLSHGMTFADENQISALELQRNIRFMFQVLYHKDRFHVEQMVSELINKSNYHNIYQWLDNPDWGS